MKNGKPITLEQRLDRLEAEMKEIKALLQAQQGPKEPWWKPFVGMYMDDPVAQEVMNSVLEEREKERRKARRQRSKTKKKPAGVDQ